MLISGSSQYGTVQFSSDFVQEAIFCDRYDDDCLREFIGAVRVYVLYEYTDFYLFIHIYLAAIYASQKTCSTIIILDVIIAFL